MGQFYRGGRLWSAETLHLQSSASLTGSSEITLASQPGPTTAATIHVVSTSADDAPYADGTPDIPATPELCTVTLAGTPQAAASGSDAVTDVWTAALAGGGPSDGDTFTVAIAGGANSPYVGTYHSPDAPTVVFGDIAALIAVDGQYTAGLVGMDFVVTAVAAGPGHVISSSTTSSGVTFGPAINTFVGADAVPPVLASTASVTDGTNTYAVTYVTGSIDNMATDLAAAIDGHNGYSASATGADVHVSGPTGYTLTDASTNGVTASFNVTDPGSVDIPATGSNGLGARTLLVEYLDGEGVQQKTTLTLNGLTPVDGPEAIWVQRITVASTGANGTAGTVTAKIGSTAFCTVVADDVQSHNLAYVVPAGKQLRLTGVLATASAVTRIRVRATHDPETGLSFDGPQLAVADFQTNLTPNAVALPYACGPFPAGAFLAVTAQASSGTVVASLDGFLEPEGAR